ncbi:IPT/TIG domain-containing protein [Humibacter sp. RRB41]|uniref:IPT/TIG domain-containing protein n=1 Tax=Humibacter sp. RRB41 TaxID=2919946 RepID=UPI001FA96C4E|nr:IPT/TIG domain-containing protein [Humibacter sp. RRB41]
MSVDKTKTIVPGHGTFFTADIGATFPENPLTAFTLTGTPPTGWVNVGHTSKDNTAAFTRDGGDKNSLDSWLQDGVVVTYDAVTWSLQVNSLQLDQTNLDLAFDGETDTDGGYIVPASSTGIDKQAFLLGTDGTGSLGFWMPNTNVTLGDDPSIDPTKFFELPLGVSILSADPEVLAVSDGRAAIMKIFKTGNVPAIPVITSATPTAATAGSMLEIVGTGFTGTVPTTGVKIGGSNATSFIVIDDSHIVAIVPAGSAGSAPIVVTNAAGASASFPYTRGA